MYLRIARVRFDPAQYDEVWALIEALVAEALVVTLRQQPGFQGYYGAGDRTNGTAVAVSLWDTQEHAQLDCAAPDDVIPRAQALGLEFEPAEVYEVVAQT